MVHEKFRGMKLGFVLYNHIVSHVGTESCQPLGDGTFALACRHRISVASFCNRDGTLISTAARHRDMLFGGLNPDHRVRRICDLPNKDVDLPAVSDGTKHFDGSSMSLSAVLAPMSEINQHHYTGSERQLYFPGSQMPPTV